MDATEARVTAVLCNQDIRNKKIPQGVEKAAYDFASIMRSVKKAAKNGKFEHYVDRPWFCNYVDEYYEALAKMFESLGYKTQVTVIYKRLKITWNAV